MGKANHDHPDRPRRQFCRRFCGGVRRLLRRAVALDSFYARPLRLHLLDMGRRVMNPHPMNAKLLERLRFIDFTLDHFGLIQRAHLIDYFGISEPQASNDFSHYKSIAPANMAYDLTARAYRKTDAFARQLP